jgi:hypothetical protein
MSVRIVIPPEKLAAALAKAFTKSVIEQIEKEHAKLTGRSSD